MKRTLILQLTLGLAALFLVGGFCGFALAERSGARSPTEAAPLPRSEEIWLEKHYQETVSRVGLDAAQASRLRQHYDHLTSAIRAIREDTSRQLGGAFARHKENVLPDLTPEQRDRYEALVSERKAARQR